MRKFIFNTFYFLIVLLILNTLFSHWGNNIYMDNYKDVSLEYKSFLLSDSHGLPLSGYTNKYGVYNFSAESESYFDMKRKLNYLIKNTKVDTIYITVDDHTFSSYRETSNNLDRSVFYTTVEDYPNIFSYLKDKLIFNITFFQPKKGMVIKSYFISTIKKIIFNNHSSETLVSKKNIEWSNMNNDQRLKSSKNRYHNQFPTMEKSLKLENSLKQIIIMCNENNIVLIGIKYPLAKDYIGFLDNFSYRASELFEDNGLIVLDYTNIYVNKDDYFLDQDHLNLEGGRIFTDLIFSTGKKHERTTNHIQNR